jgi:hypothetical protein
MITDKLTQTDIAILRAAILTPSGDRLINYILGKNSPAFDPYSASDHNAESIAFKAAYSQGYIDALNALLTTLIPQERLEDMQNTTFQSPNDSPSTI